MFLWFSPARLHLSKYGIKLWRPVILRNWERHICDSFAEKKMWSLPPWGSCLMDLPKYIWGKSYDHSEWPGPDLGRVFTSEPASTRRPMAMSVLLTSLFLALLRDQHSQLPGLWSARTKSASSGPSQHHISKKQSSPSQMAKFRTPKCLLNTLLVRRWLRYLSPSLWRASFMNMLDELQ